MKILLVVYDNESYMSFFPQGIAYIAATLRKASHKVIIYNQDQYHYPEEHLTDTLDRNNFDVVGVGMVAGYYQFEKLIKISVAINRSKNKPFFVLGGHMVTPEPEFFIKLSGCDAVVMGEGEETIVELMDSLENKKDFSTINGLAYCKGEQIIVNPRREPISDLDAIEKPAYDLFPINYYRLYRKPHTSHTDFIMPVSAARGCKFHCNFCYRMDKGYRRRSSESIIEEIKYLQKDYGINYIVFSDELFMGSEKDAIERSEAFIDAGLKMKWSCDGRLNYASPVVLKTMKKSGCVFINYGIESLDQEVLKNCRKGLIIKQIHEGIANTYNAGISPGLNLIWGNIGDTKESLDKAVSFLLKYDDGAQLRTLRPVTPYPGCPLYYEAIKRGKIKDIEDFYRKHKNSDLLTVNFTDYTDEIFHNLLGEANKKLLKNYYGRLLAKSLDETEKLYQGVNINFRGYRQT